MTCIAKRSRESKELQVDIVEKVPQSVLASDLKIYERSVRKTFIASMKFLLSCLTIWVLLPLAQGSYYFCFLVWLYEYLCLLLKALARAERFFFFFFKVLFSLFFFTKTLFNLFVSWRDP